VAPFSFPQNRGEVPATEGKTLLDLAGHGNFGPGTGHAELSGENPHRTGFVIELKGSSSNCTIGVDHPSDDGYLFADVATWITIDLRDAHSWRAAGKEQNSYSKQEYGKNPGTEVEHIISPEVNYRATALTRPGLLSCGFLSRTVMQAAA
jgi:hypothetical protein